MESFKGTIGKFHWDFRGIGLFPVLAFFDRNTAFLEAETHLKRLLARFYIDPTHSQTKRTHPDPIRTIFNENLEFPKTSKPFSLHLNPLQRGVDPSQKIPDIILLRIHIFSSHDDPWRPHSSKLSFLLASSPFRVPAGAFLYRKKQRFCF